MFQVREIKPHPIITSHRTIMDNEDAVAAFGSKKAELSALVCLADKYYQQAKSGIYNLRSSADIVQYYKLVKLSIKCYRLILSKYEMALDPKTKGLVYFKLAELYFHEVQDYSESESLIAKLIAICHRNKFNDLHVAGIVLYLKITSHVDPEYSFSQLKDFMFIFRDSSNMTCLFYILSYQLFHHETIMKKDFPVKTVLDAASHADKDVGSCLAIILAYNLLSHGNLKSFNLCMNQINDDLLIESLPVQIQCMLHIANLYACLLSGDKIKFKSTAKALDRINQKQKEESWSQWKLSGAFNITLNYSLLNLNFEFKWLNKDQFLCLLRLLVGLNIIDRLIPAALQMLKSSLKSVSSLIKSIEDRQIDFQGSINDCNLLFHLNGFILFNVIYYCEWCKIFGYGSIETLEDFRSEGCFSELNHLFWDKDEKSTTGNEFTQVIGKEYQRKLAYLDGLKFVLNKNIFEARNQFESLMDEGVTDDIAYYSIYQHISLLLWRHEADVNAKQLENAINKDFKILRNWSKKEHTAEDFNMISFNSRPDYESDIKILHAIFEILQYRDSGSARVIYQKIAGFGTINSVFINILYHLVSCIFEKYSAEINKRMERCLSLQTRLPKGNNLLKILVYKAQLLFMQYDDVLPAEKEEVKLRILKLKQES